MKKILIVIYLFFSGFIFAQELIISTNQNPAIVGEKILIQFSIDAQGKNFESPKFNGLQVLSGPNPSTSSSYTFINGKSESKTTTVYSFYLKAAKKGIFNISSAKVVVEGKEIKSKPYQLKVVEKSNNKKLEKSLNNDLFIKVSTNKKNILVGEQILVTYKLFTRLDLENAEPSKMPNLNGFWVKDLETSSRFKRDVINGVPFNTVVIKKSVLTAQKSGKLVLDPLELKCNVRTMNRRNSRDPFANFFGNTYQIEEKIILSKPVSINVSDLPMHSKKFKGAVGDFKLASEIDKTELKTNEALTYKIILSGTGNIELIDPIDIKFPSDFEVFDPKITNKIFEGGRKRSVKIFEYLLIPRNKGEYIIPKASLIYFNIKSKSYKTELSQEHKIKVELNPNEENQENSNFQQIIKNEKKDINYIFNNTKLIKPSSRLIEKNLYYLIYFSPIFLLIVFYFFVKYKKNNNAKWRTNKANKIALKRLKNAQKYLDDKNNEGFFEEIEKSLWGYFSDKFKVSSANLSKENISLYFKQYKVDDDIKIKFVKLLDDCELARYSPFNKTDVTKDMLNKAKDIIIKVETELK